LKSQLIDTYNEHGAAAETKRWFVLFCIKRLSIYGDKVSGTPSNPIPHYRQRGENNKNKHRTQKTETNKQINKQKQQQNKTNNKQTNKINQNKQKNKNIYISNLVHVTRSWNNLHRVCS
jgi:hypothetical protein